MSQSPRISAYSLASALTRRASLIVKRYSPCLTHIVVLRKPKTRKCTVRLTAKKPSKLLRVSLLMNKIHRATHGGVGLGPPETVRPNTRGKEKTRSSQGIRIQIKVNFCWFVDPYLFRVQKRWKTQHPGLQNWQQGLFEILSPKRSTSRRRSWKSIKHS